MTEGRVKLAVSLNGDDLLDVVTEQRIRAVEVAYGLPDKQRILEGLTKHDATVSGLAVNYVDVRDGRADIKSLVAEAKFWSTSLIVLQNCDEQDFKAVRALDQQVERHGDVTFLIENHRLERDYLIALFTVHGIEHLRLALNPAELARMGVKPFLEAIYRSLLRHLVDLLYVADATRDGVAQFPGQGHAEIKEIVSILHATGFDGPMVLRHDRNDLREAVRRSYRLLETM